MKKIGLLLTIVLSASIVGCATGDYSYRFAGLQERWGVGQVGGESYLSKMIQRAVLKDDKIVITENVLFETGSDHILEESHSLLDEVAGVLEDHPEVDQIRVEGHTDSQGDHDFNQTLSQKRAESVRTYLIENDGIAAERLTAQGFGDTRPIADNETDVGRAQNRRVEFIVVH